MNNNLYEIRNIDGIVEFIVLANSEPKAVDYLKNIGITLEKPYHAELIEEKFWKALGYQDTIEISNNPDLITVNCYK